MLSLEKYRARFGLVAVAALILGGAAAALLVLLDAQWARILVAAVSWAGALGLTVFLVRRARARERVRREAIAKAEARHRSLLEGMPVVAWLRETGESNETTYVGPAIAELTGYSASEWREQPDLHEKLLHPDDRDRVLPELERAVGGAPISIDYRLLARDGRATWVREDTATVLDHKGEPLYLQTFLRDIRELKRSEDRREEVQAAERDATAESAERQGRLDLLRRAGNDLAASVEVDGALGRVSELIVADFADWCVIDVVDAGNQLQRVAPARAEVTQPNGARGPSDDPEAEVRAVFESGRTRVVPPLGDTSSGQRAEFLGLEVRSVICVPLWARKQPLGVLTIARTERGPAYSADDVALA